MLISDPAFATITQQQALLCVLKDQICFSYHFHVQQINSIHPGLYCRSSVYLQPFFFSYQAQMLPVKASPPGVSRCRREVSCFPPRSPLDTSHAACLSAQARPRAFYGAVIQGWLENSCGDLHHHLCVCVCVSACSPATSLNLGKCHQQVNGNVLFPCC